MARNLLKNPSGEEELNFWELIENGGSQWKVEDMPGDCGHDFCSEGVTKYFATSFELCLKRQVIDLLAEGFSSEQLDAQPPVTVQDWYCGRTDCGCTYQMTVCLLDENHEVIQEFRPDSVTLDPDCDDCSWKQVSHTFSDYGPGMRFISFEHGGQDTKFWDGWFGVRVTGSSVTIELTK
ncbi:DNA helicase MCM8 [Sarotherodon galilaeus]